MSISFLFALRRRWPLLVFLPLIAAIVVALLPSQKTPPQYRATEIVAVESQSGSFATVQQDVYLVRQPAVARRAAETLGSSAPPLDLAAGIKATADQTSLTIAFSTVADSPEEATRYVHAFAEAFVAEMTVRADSDQEAATSAAQRQSDVAKAAYDQFLLENGAALAGGSPSPVLLARRDDLSSQVASASQALSQAQASAGQNEVTYQALGVSAPSTVTSRLSVFDKRWVRSLTAAVAAFVLAAALAALIEKFNPRVDDRSIAEQLTGVPVLTMVPYVSRHRWRGRFGRADPVTFTGPFAESYRVMRSHLEFLDQAGAAATNGNGDSAGARDRGTVVAIVSPTPGDGKSVTAAYLALCYAETAGPEPLVLSCDFRRPTFHRLVGLSASPGFSDRRNIQDNDGGLAALVQSDPVTRISMIASGPATSRVVDLLPDVSAVAHAASATGRAVIIDTAPILIASDAVELAGMADHIILVIRAGRTSRRAVQEATIALQLNERTITGCVLVGSREADEASGYYYGYYKEPTTRAMKKAAKRAREREAVGDSG